MPVYVPRELVHAAGMLPLGIMGAGENLEVIHGDAYYQSYICRIPRSTLELGVTGRIDFVDGFLFPSICDVIRNLSGIWKLQFPNVYVRYFDVPQNYQDGVGGTRPSVGFSPRMPQQAAGRRVEAPASVASDSGPSPAATAAAEPPEEPPGTRLASQGFCTAP